MRVTLISMLLLFVALACGDSKMSSQQGQSACQPVACKCLDGRAGLQTCQLDGTLSVCQCNQGIAGSAGTGASGAAASTAGTGGPLAGTGAAGTGGATGVAGTAGTAGAAGTGGIPAIVVPPEDVAACNANGAAPSAQEVTEVLQIRTSDVVAGGYQTPGGTYYACFWKEIDMPEKAHIIGWEGQVNGSTAVHHQQVSISKKPPYLTQQGGLCRLPTVEFTWTGNKPTEWSPALAGYPIGGPENGGKAYFVWQVHFEGGATKYSGGFNAIITHNLRKYDAGTFEQGDMAGISIPPGKQTHVATCGADKTTAKLGAPIYAFSSLLHAHLLVQSMSSELTRGGQQVHSFGSVAVQNGFFDQEFRPQSPCVEIRPGDTITTTCNYDNGTGQTVVGGEATTQEMCMNFLIYFPRLPNPSDGYCGTIEGQ